MRRMVISVCRRSASFRLRAVKRSKTKGRRENTPRARRRGIFERWISKLRRSVASRARNFIPLIPAQAGIQSGSRQKQGDRLGQIVTQTAADNRALCGPLRGGEGAATTALLRRLRTVAALRAQTVPAQSRLPRRSASLPCSRARHRAAPTAGASAGGHFGGDAGEYRRARTRGAAVHAARFLRRYRRPGRYAGVEAAALHGQDRSRRRKCAYASTSAR